MLFTAPGLNKTSVSHPVGSQHPPLPPFPSFLLSFWPLALTLHAVDFLPCSPKSRVSGEPIWAEVSLMKLLDFGAVHSPLASSFSTSLQRTPPQTLTGLSHPIIEIVNNANHKESPHMLLIILQFGALITAHNQPELHPLGFNCLTDAFYYSNHYCHLELKRCIEPSENLNTYKK